jgi:hypothetical protein
MPTWEPMVVLPNVQLSSSIDSEWIALAPSGDSRVVATIQKHHEFGAFLGKFQDAFANPIKPSILLLREDAHPNLRGIDAIAGFRDAIAIASVPQSRARFFNGSAVARCHWSNYFHFYPWMLSKDYDTLVARTPAILAVDDFQNFRGQSSPDLRPLVLDFCQSDTNLFAAIMDRFNECYTASSPSWTTLALFRSLNMACKASEMPGGVDFTLYDEGRLISLWVAAFEILAHHGPGGRSGVTDVLAVLEKVALIVTSLGQETHATRLGDRSLVSRLYVELSDVRNDFSHGNPVASDRIFAQGTQIQLSMVAAMLFRLALTAHLNVSWIEPEPGGDDIIVYAEWRARKSAFLDGQRTIENGLAKALL